MLTTAEIGAFLWMGYGILAFLVGLAILWWSRASPVGQAAFGFVATMGLAQTFVSFSFIERVIPWDGATRPFFAMHLVLFTTANAFWLRLAALATQSPALAVLRTTRGFGLTFAVFAGAATAYSTAYVFLAPQGKWFYIFDDFLLTLTGLFVATVAILSHRRTRKGTPERRRAASYLTTFLVHDVTMISALAYSTALIALLPNQGDYPAFFGWAFVISGVLLIVLFLPLLVYSTLTGKIEGLDGRFRTGVSTFSAATIVAVLFVASLEALEAVFDVQNVFLGVATAVLLALMFQPIQRWAERGALRLFPGTMATAAAYQRAVELALADGSISPAERRVLDGMAARLK